MKPTFLDANGQRDVIRRTAERLQQKAVKANAVPAKDVGNDVFLAKGEVIANDFAASFHEEDNFTIATLCFGDRKNTFIGVAKRNPKDRPMRMRGQALALTRAAKKALMAQS